MKQGTEQLLAMAVFVAIGCMLGVFLVSYYDLDNIFMFALGFIAGILVSIVLHEMGHLLFGRLSGYRFVSFRLIKWQWAKNENGRIERKKSAGLKGIGGQCLMEPPEDEKEFRYVLYNAGGALMNLITSAAFLIPAFFIENGIISPFLVGMGCTSVIIGISNILPLSLSGYPSDGKNIFTAKRSPEAKHGFYVLLRTNGEMSKGKRLSDYDDNAFFVSESADKNNHFVATLIILRASQLEEKGDFRQSHQELQRLDSSKISPLYGNQVIMSMIFHELVYFGDGPSVNSARERFESKTKDKIFNNLLNMKHPVFIPYRAAIEAFLEKDIDNARMLISQARELLPSLQNPGMEYSIELALDRLEARLNTNEADLLE